MQKKSKGKGLLTIAFCIVIILLCLYGQYLIMEYTKFNMLEMEEWKSSIESENESYEAEEAGNGSASEAGEDVSAESAE